MITDYRDPEYWRQRRPAPPAWPAADPPPEILSTDPWPEGVPVPGPVRDLAARAELEGWAVRLGYSRGPERAVRVGTYKITEAIGVWAGPHPVTRWRFCAVYGHTVNRPWSWRSISIWRPGGNRFTEAMVTDLKEWLTVRGDVGKPWFKAITAREADKVDRARAAARARPKGKKEGAS